MRLQDFLDEEGLELDDVRWYLAEQTADRLLNLQEDRYELIRLVWSGQLERELRDPADRFLADIDSRVADGSIDEAMLHRTIAEIAASKQRRNRAGM